MERKAAFVFVLMGLMVFTTGCTGKKYSDLVEVNTQFVDAMEDYLDATEKATTGKDMARAISDYAEKIEKIAPLMKEMRVKYSELSNPADLPEELQVLNERSAELEQKIMGSYMNMMKFIMDQDVQAAQQKLQNAMMKME